MGRLGLIILAVILLAASACAAAAPKTAAEHGVMFGFPPPADKRVTLDNWDAPPFNRWSFQHIRRVLPTAAIRRGSATPVRFERNPRDMENLPFKTLEGGTSTVAEMLAQTYTDGFLVLYKGRIIVERYFNDMQPASPHLLQSVSKSMVGTLATVLIHRGLLDMSQPVARYVPELGNSGYDNATIGHVLNMTSGVAATEEYANPAGEVTRHEVAMGWKPPRNAVPASNYEFLPTLDADHDHGRRFLYRSCETDVLAWVLQRASGRPLEDLLSEHIWAKLGAEHNASITLDPAGMAVASGGVSATLRDVGRFAQMMVQAGTFNDRQVVPEKQVLSIRAAETTLFGHPYTQITPAKAYHNHWWIRDVDRGILLALGEFGQLIYIDPSREFVAVKLSSWPTHDNTRFQWDAINAIEAIAERMTEGEKPPAGKDE